MSLVIPLSWMWVGIASIALWLVWMCLRVITTDLGYGLSWHNLKVEAHTLRIKQIDELRTIRESVFQKTAQSQGLDYNAMKEGAGSIPSPEQSSEQVLEEDGLVQEVAA